MTWPRPFSLFLRLNQWRDSKRTYFCWFLCNWIAYFSIEACNQIAKNIFFFLIPGVTYRSHMGAGTGKHLNTAFWHDDGSPSIYISSFEWAVRRWDDCIGLLCLLRTVCKAILSFHTQGSIFMHNTSLAWGPRTKKRGGGCFAQPTLWLEK